MRGKLKWVYSMALLGLMIIPGSFLHAEGEIYVTRVSMEPLADGGDVKGLATIVLNNCIKIQEIEVVETADGKKDLKFPVYISSRKKVFPQMELLSRTAKEEIERAVFSGKPSDASARTISFKISKFQRYRGQSSLKVFVSVDFNKAIRIECKIMESRLGPWVSWPARKDENSGKYINQVQLINDKVRKVVEKAILDKYNKMLTETEEDSDNGSLIEEE